MHVPDADKATLDLKTLTHYLLVPDHPEGGPRAKDLTLIPRQKAPFRYLVEFDFCCDERKITEEERAMVALKGIVGKRLTYRLLSGA
ncbi:hypothetical protein VH569_18670 [Azospirillum sp. 11R-A]|uniref:hypothetical protein n=1 Tax=Azospirillum sp. 11R-A TaxID=3111634 RepID=UPI003C274152